MIDRLSKWVGGWTTAYRPKSETSAKALQRLGANQAIDELCSMAPGARQAVAMTQAACVQLRQQAFDGDVPRLLEMVEALQLRAGVLAGQRLPSVQTLASKAWETDRPAVALLGVYSGLFTPEAYIQRFDTARAQWAELVLNGILLPEVFSNKFFVGIADALCWWDAGVLTPNNVASVLWRQPRCLFQLEAFGRLEKKQSYTERLLEGLPIAPAAVDNDAGLLDLALAQLLSGEMDTFNYSETVPRPPPEHLEAICETFHAGHKDWDRYDMMVLGAVGIEELWLGELAGFWRAKEVAYYRPLPDALAEQWLNEERLETEDYIKLSVHTWHREDALPSLHQILARQAPDPDTLLATLVLPKDSPTRRAYALRMVACHLKSDRASRGGVGVDGDAWHFVRRHRTYPAHFRHCPTPLCVGGLSVAASVERARLDCTVCNQTSFVGPPDFMAVIGAYGSA